MRPARELATNNGQTYFVTSNTAGRTPFFRHERWSRLFVDTLYSYRPERYFIHGFTVIELDAFPRGLKPNFVERPSGAAKAASFQNKDGGLDAPVVQGKRDSKSPFMNSSERR